MGGEQGEQCSWGQVPSRVHAGMLTHAHTPPCPDGHMLRDGWWDRRRLWSLAFLVLVSPAQCWPFRWILAGGDGGWRTCPLPGLLLGCGQSLPVSVLVSSPVTWLQPPTFPGEGDRQRSLCHLPKCPASHWCADQLWMTEWGSGDYPGVGQATPVPPPGLPSSCFPFSEVRTLSSSLLHLILGSPGPARHPPHPARPRAPAVAEVCGQVPKGLLQVTARLCGCRGEDTVLSNSEQSLCMSNERSACPGGAAESPAPVSLMWLCTCETPISKSQAGTTQGRGPHAHSPQELGKVCVLLPCVRFGGLARASKLGALREVTSPLWGRSCGYAIPIVHSGAVELAMGQDQGPLGPLWGRPEPLTT